MVFDVFAKLLSSVATFLFPVFASYKALKTSDPALLTPWLMYWVVLACALLAESWIGFVLVWIPFYPWIRAGFLLYLIAPQTQGARILYQTHVHPFLQEHENSIEDFIASAHEKAKAAGLSYLKQAIELLKQNILGLPPTKPSPPATPTGPPRSYTQSLIARFNLPNARPAFPTASMGSAVGGATSTAADFYSLLASAVSAASSPGAKAASTNQDDNTHQLSNSGTLIPPSIAGADRMTFISAQREKLQILLSALDKEATNVTTQDPTQSKGNHSLIDCLDGASPDIERPMSAMSGLSKSRSEADFEKIDADVASEERPVIKQRSGSWMPWSWGAKADEPVKSAQDKNNSAGIEVSNVKGKSSAMDI